MNDYKELTLDDLVEISGHDDVLFEEHYERDERGFYHRIPHPNTI